MDNWEAASEVCSVDPPSLDVKITIVEETVTTGDRDTVLVAVTVAEIGTLVTTFVRTVITIAISTIAFLLTETAGEVTDETAAKLALVDAVVTLVGVAVTVAVTTRETTGAVVIPWAVGAETEASAPAVPTRARVTSASTSRS
jgi:hypothetical protein